MAGMLGGQAGMMMTDPYMVHTTRAEARAERKLAALVAGFGEITRNNLLQFLFVFGRFSTAEDISYRQARTRLEDIVSPMVKQEIDSILEDAGPEVTATAARSQGSSRITEAHQRHTGHADGMGCSLQIIGQGQDAGNNSSAVRQMGHDERDKAKVEIPEHMAREREWTNVQYP